MPSMTRHERALTYAKRLKSSTDPIREANEILSELNSLVWAENNRPLSREERIKILDEVKSIIIHGEKAPNGEILVEAADNSGLLDVIDMLKTKVK